MAREVRARSIGLQAARTLQPGTEGRVLATFHHVCDLATDDGEVIALVLGEVGDGPLNVVLDITSWEPPLWPHPGTRFRVQGRNPLPASTSVAPLPPAARIRLDPRPPLGSAGAPAQGRDVRYGSPFPSSGCLLQVDLSTALLWDPRPDWPALASLVPWPGPVARVAWPGRAAGQRPPARTRPAWGQPDHSERQQLLRAIETLACVLAECPTGSMDAAGMPGPGREIWREAAQRVIHARGSGRLDALSLAINDLCGLGPGLTPAGDDWLAGWLLGLRARGDLHSVEYGGVVIRRAAATRTTALSRALLACAARGEVNVRWHRLLAALATSPASHEAIRRAGQAILAQGASSGPAMLAGFLAGMGWPPFGQVYYHEPLAQTTTEAVGSRQ